MDEKIIQQLRAKKISEMKNPTILMNKSDFDSFKERLESTVLNFKVGDKPTYQNIPIKVSTKIESGNIVVYDSLNYI